MTKSQKATVASRTLLFAKIIAAIAQFLTVAILLRGKDLTPQALSGLFQAYLQAEKDLEDARTTVTARKQVRDAALAAVNAVMPDLRKFLASTYGEQSTTYAAFGFPVTQHAEKSAQVKADAAAKAAATRKSHEAAAKPPATPAPVTPKA